VGLWKSLMWLVVNLCYTFVYVFLDDFENKTLKHINGSFEFGSKMPMTSLVVPFNICIMLLIWLFFFLFYFFILLLALFRAVGLVFVY
jgi:hypothetical protein